ncbi:MAG: hypothetical protein JKY02_01775 [Flavobacteriaceae bacterium]|nr:hypothetical protein [Flavobacteriaceae bacterium]
MTINFYNKTGNKNLYLFFAYADDSQTSGVTGFSNLSYPQPWADGSLAKTDPHVCSFDYLNSGTFWYILTNDTGAKTIKNHPGISMGSEDPNWVGGFFELTYLKSDTVTYFDVTNVDQVGLLCGAEFVDSNGAAAGHCGYGETAKNLIAGIETACDLTSGTPAKKTINGTGDNASDTYTKLWGPTVGLVSGEYNAIYTKYINKITTNGTKLTINSDSTKSNQVTHGGTQLDSFKFTGAFGQPTFDMPTGSKIKKSDVVLWFECTEVIDPAKTSETTYIFFTKEAIDSGTIASGNSAGGMYIYPAFEYTDPNAKDPSKIIKGGWANNVSLNRTAIGADAVKNTTCFQAMISSVGRDVVTAMNLGYIGISAATKDFTYKVTSTYATAATQSKYINQWNKYITDHSDSYGMAYSDGTHAKVQFHPKPDGTINCFIFGQDDKDTSDFWSKNKPA